MVERILHNFIGAGEDKNDGDDSDNGAVDADDANDNDANDAADDAADVDDADVVECYKREMHENIWVFKNELEAPRRILDAAEGLKTIVSEERVVKNGTKVVEEQLIKINCCRKVVEN
ncbi:unnamed protein product [Ceratitis capitata]|uniref:(Mediterranean fruit fly) hypothetical protein n=1 Tax=Ceratitis capitata TaxID=7213 RepID=A0A811TZ09_CERCA|nr:unnamed protein product [Ceratitis capitata]